MKLLFRRYAVNAVCIKEEKKDAGARKICFCFERNS
jgi:hypothetical protein